MKGPSAFGIMRLTLIFTCVYGRSTRKAFDGHPSILKWHLGAMPEIGPVLTLECGHGYVSA